MKPKLINIQVIEGKPLGCFRSVFLFWFLALTVNHVVNIIFNQTTLNVKELAFFAGVALLFASIAYLINRFWVVAVSNAGVISRFGIIWWKWTRWEDVDSAKIGRMPAKRFLIFFLNDSSRRNVDISYLSTEELTKLVDIVQENCQKVVVSEQLFEPITPRQSVTAK